MQLAPGGSQLKDTFVMRSDSLNLYMCMQYPGWHNFVSCMKSKEPALKCGQGNKKDTHMCIQICT